LEHWRILEDSLAGGELNRGIDARAFLRLGERDRGIS
jgi:hypothetical protein